MAGRRRVRPRSAREVLGHVLVAVGLALFVLSVYVVVVLGGGALVGRTSSPAVGLSVLATAAVALAFEPVQRRLEEVARHAVQGGRRSPYDVVSRFSGALTTSYAVEEIPGRMARLLAEGTGAARAEVWILVDGRLVLTSTWPDGEPAPTAEEPPGRRTREVRQAGELLGALVVQEREQVPLTAVEERLFAGLADQAGLVLRGVRLRAELVRRLGELSARADELRLSRQRVVDAQDRERRRLERDIHDGAQQHLVALAVNLRLAHRLLTRAPDRADLLLTQQERATADALGTIADLARGIYPRLLTEHGLVAALRSAASGSALPVRLVADDLDRYPASAEAAAYFCALEAVQNAAKHSGALGVRVDLRGLPDGLEIVVEDDGVGFDTAAVPAGAGLVNIRDRVESAGGTVALSSARDTGTRVTVRLPGARVPVQSGG